MLSAQGGVEIEVVAEKDPDAIAKIYVDPVVGLDRSGVPRVGASAPSSTRRPSTARSTSSASSTSRTPRATRTSCEINPLILTPDGRVHALDAKVTLDDNAVFRHPDYEQYDATQVRDEREQAAHEQGPPVRRARRLRRHHRQRRRPRDGDGGHRQPGRRRGRRTSSTSAAARTPR